uniref:Uncharacterized protein n=1 Tax=Rhizophora mucronata TaxID=61149 RepID=A0A2P2PQV9_RHIMU
MGQRCLGYDCSQSFTLFVQLCLLVSDVVFIIKVGNFSFPCWARVHVIILSGNCLSGHPHRQHDMQ